MIEHTLQAWATEWGMERRTLEAQLIRDGYILPKKKKGHKIRGRIIRNATMGGKEVQTIRNLKLDADEKEREQREADGRLVDVDMLKAWCVQWFGGVRQAIDAAPDTVSKEWANKVFVPAVMKVAEDMAKLPQKREGA